MAVRVEWRRSVALVGTVIKYLAITMLLPLGVGLVYGEDALVFLAAMAVAVGIGLVLERAGDGGDLGPREAILFVSLAWGTVAIVGAVPYVIAGQGTASTLANPVNALFESMSGFTTTGSTVMGEISFDRHSHAVLIWRQLTQWLGGMGIIVLMVAILPEIAVNGAQLIDSEAPGPELQKMTPRIVETARLLWLFYIAVTALYVCLLILLNAAGLAPNMNLYNAVAHGFTTLPTGGFSPQADSIAHFSPAVQWVVIPFMIVAGTNFALFYYFLQGEYRSFFRDREFQAYIGAIAGLILILWGLLFTGAAPPLELGGRTQGVLENSLRQAAFQIGSLMNSTGYATSDFAKWDTPAQAVLLFAMFIGGSAGSTGGGVKIVRWLVILKAARRQLLTSTRPDVVRPLRLGGHVIDEDVVRAVFGFTFLYLLVFGISAVLIALDAHRIGLELTTLEAVSASLATIGNIGPGFGLLGPFGSFLGFPPTSKLLMTILMWLGRLEVIPVLVLFTGPFWKE
ncbi:MAG: TrkH family potassium uptake protein [Halobacteriales archaeon]